MLENMQSVGLYDRHGDNKRPKQTKDMEQEPQYEATTMVIPSADDAALSHQWISVDERLPNEDKEVLCRMKSNGAVVSGFIFKNEKRHPTSRHIARFSF